MDGRDAIQHGMDVRVLLLLHHAPHNKHRLHFRRVRKASAVLLLYPLFFSVQRLGQLTPLAVVGTEPSVLAGLT